MRNSKIVGKIPRNRETFNLGNDELLISVIGGEIAELIRGGGSYPIQQDDVTEWYFVDEGENSFEFSYNGGSINFTFTICGRVAFPTLLISSNYLLKTKMPDAVSEWIGSVGATNLITDFLAKRGISDEMMLFGGNGCALLERELMLFCREHFIKEFGMLLDRVEIKKKVVAKKAQPTPKPTEAKKSENQQKSKYRFII
jgi:hypothetical protein